MSIKGTSKGGGRGKSEKSLANLKNAKIGNIREKIDSEKESYFSEENDSKAEKIKNKLESLVSKKELQEVDEGVKRLENMIKEGRTVSPFMFALNTHTGTGISQKQTKNATEIKEMIEKGTIIKEYKDVQKKNAQEATKAYMKNIEKQRNDVKGFIPISKLKINKETDKAYGVAIKSEYYDIVAGENKTKRDTMWIPKSWFTSDRISPNSIKDKLKEYEWSYNSSTRKYELD